MATTPAPEAPPAWFRIAALLALVWNAFGLIMYLSAVGVFGHPTASLTEAERAAAGAIPSWIMLAFALGTSAGVVGSLGLLLGRRWALPMLILSALALLVLEGWIIFLSGQSPIHGLAIPVAVSVIGILLAVMAVRARKRGWLR